MKHEKYEKLVELYTILEEKLGDVLKPQCSDLMDNPKFVKVYRLILGYSLENFSSECNLDSNLLKDIESGKKLEYNIATKIFETIIRLIKNNKLEKSSPDILSKNYLTFEIIKSKNLHTLAKHQTRYLFFGQTSNRFISFLYILLFINLLSFASPFSFIIKIFVLVLSLIITAYFIFLGTQFFLWDNDIISNFICLLLKKSYLESNAEIKKILLVLASRLDDSFIKYHEPYWYFNSIRKELADVIRDYILPNINETNKDKILIYFENISVFLSSYSIDEYEEIKKLTIDIKTEFVEKRNIEQTKYDRLILALNSGFISPAFYVVKNIIDILIKTSAYWILAVIVGSVTYYLTNNLQFSGLIIAFLGSIFVIYTNIVNKSK